MKLKFNLLQLILICVLLFLSISCSSPGGHREMHELKHEVETPEKEKSPEVIPDSAHSSDSSKGLNEYKVREVSFDGKKIYLPAKLPREQFQDADTERQKELAEAEGIYINQGRWESEAKTVLEEMQKHNCIKPGYRIVDLGGGTGYYSMIFSQIVGSPGMIYLLDVDMDLLNNALRIISYNCREAKKDNIGLYYSNIVPLLSCPDSMLLERESVDTVFASDIHIFHVHPDRKKFETQEAKKPGQIQALMVKTTSEEQAGIINSIYETLKPNGNLVIIESIFSDDTTLRNDREGIRQIFEASGFKMIADIHRLDNNERKFHFFIFRKTEKISAMNDHREAEVFLLS